MKYVLLFVLLYIFLIKPPFKTKNVKGLYTHRGFYKKDQSVLENSLEAFSASIDHNYGIELDVQLSSDNVVYVFHDEDLNRLLGQDVLLKDLSSQEIDELQINGHKIPKFNEVLELVDGQVPLIVELKPKGNYVLLAEKTVALLDSYNGDFVVESFDPRIVFWFRVHRPNYTRGQLIMEPKEYEKPILVRIWTSLWINFLTRPHFMAVHKHLFPLSLNLKIYHWLGGSIVSWTIHKEDPYYKEDAIIFEFYEA